MIIAIGCNEKDVKEEQNSTQELNKETQNENGD